MTPLFIRCWVFHNNSVSELVEAGSCSGSFALCSV
jgi:hypothetical protein